MRFWSLLPLFLSVAFFFHQSSAQNGYEVIIAPGRVHIRCEDHYPGVFGIMDPSATAPGPCSRTDGPGYICRYPKTLAMTLENGILTDAFGRIGSIGADRSFKFNEPQSQQDVVYNGGWFICHDGVDRLALGSQSSFFRCQRGEYMLLFDQAVADDCAMVDLWITEFRDELCEGE